MKRNLRYLTSPARFFKLFFRMLSGVAAMASGKYRRNISPQFSERISLVVSGVNECAYCTYLHTKTSLEKGLSREEIRSMLEGTLGDVDVREAPALMYAQHWADAEGSPSKEAFNRIAEEYGDATARLIHRSIAVVYFGNLCSNTVHAVQSGQVGKYAGFRQWLTYILCLPVGAAIRKAGSGADNSR